MPSAPLLPLYQLDLSCQTQPHDVPASACTAHVTNRMRRCVRVVSLSLTMRPVRRSSREHLSTSVISVYTHAARTNALLIPVVSPPSIARRPGCRSGAEYLKAGWRAISASRSWQTVLVQAPLTAIAFVPNDRVFSTFRTAKTRLFRQRHLDQNEAKSTPTHQNWSP
jgi:hypothetical protein